MVETANAELAAEEDPETQLDRGRFLGHLLIPRNLRHQFFSPAPLVLMLDSTTARLHWEMVAQSESDLSLVDPGARVGDEAAPGMFRDEFFLGTSRGLTRQLRTTFAPPPEPPPPPGRVLRVLVVADPAADARLPGAAAEGVEVADLFESFNAVRGGEDRVEVTRMFGPSEATLTNVLREIMSPRPYDVLHFAGHCLYDPGRPAESGWVFSGREILTADLLDRIDRIPKFIFSNACESGVTPDRPEGYSPGLAPGFAEEFFARGVVNFVATAWPVDDLAARRFAQRVYTGLLGLDAFEPADGGPHRVVGKAAPEPMFVAMRNARLAIARRPDGRADPAGARTWGAYQHYGNPAFRPFRESTSESD